MQDLPVWRVQLPLQESAPLGGPLFFLCYYFTGTFYPFCVMQVISGVVNTLFLSGVACVCVCVQRVNRDSEARVAAALLPLFLSPNASALRAFEGASLLLRSRFLLP